MAPPPPPPGLDSMPPGEPAPAGAHVEEGRIAEVTYLGMVTRYEVELAAGGRLTAVRQNLEAAAAQALAARGASISVAWREDQAQDIEGETYGESQPAAAAPPAEQKENA